MLKVIVRTEFMLLFRNKFLAIPLIMNLLFWGYMIVAYEIQDTHIQERAAIFYSGFIWVLLFNLLIIGLFAVYMMNKDRESEFESLIVTYRVKNTEWITGKWLATQLYGLCITLITLFIQVGWFASSKMAFSDVVKNGFYVFVQMEGAFFVVISLGFLCGVLIKNIFAYILVPAILVLFLGLPLDYTDAGSALWFDNPRLHLLTPFDLMYVGSPYEGIWGIHRVFEGTLVHQSAVFLFGFIILFVTLLFFYSNRSIQKEKKIIAILMIVCMIPTLLLSGIRYVQYDQTLEKYIITGQQYAKGYGGSDQLEDYYHWLNSYYDASLDHTTYNFSMELIDLVVQLQANDQIDVTSQLTIKYHGDEPVDEVKLTLYHGLQVTECTSESLVTCTHDKDLITIHFEEIIEPGEQFDLTLNYYGNILQYRYEGNVEHAFIDKNRVYLPKEAGWYPLIGERQLIVAREHDDRYVKFEQRNGRLVEDYPTSFTVEVLNDVSEVPITLTIPEKETGIYQGTSQYGLSLIGGNMDEMKVGEVRVVGHPEVLNTVKEKVEQYQKGWDFIEDWLGEPMTPSVIYILNSRYTYLTWYTPSTEFLVWDNENLNYGDSVDEIASNLWNYWTKDFSDQAKDEGQDYHYLRNALDWVIRNHLHDEVSFREWYIAGWHEPDDDKLLNLLNSYGEIGNEAFENVVKYLLVYVDQLENKSNFEIEAALQLYEGESSL